MNPLLPSWMQVFPSLPTRDHALKPGQVKSDDAVAVLYGPPQFAT